MPLKMPTAASLGDARKDKKDTTTILVMTLLLSAHSSASSPAIQLASFLFTSKSSHL
jgi:hypothetical protein